MKNAQSIFVEALLAGDEDAAWDCVCRLSEAGFNSISLYENVFTKAMTQIGFLWEQNKVTIAEEHLATSTCNFVLTRYHHYMRKWSKPKNGKTMMLLCLDQEQHDLGVKMCACLLEEHGWTTRLLGASVPLEQAELMGEKWQPDAIALSVSIPYHARGLDLYVNTLEKLPHKPTLLIGGRLVSMYDLRPLCTEQTILIKNLSELQQWQQSQVEVSADVR
ncbi:methanogenic corrinoid protein MtbC1 [Alkalihalobacillus xiaoxiensis]|uniref:Methanogenic corrinoid protein MtbC1 n=1 Tax=Shouchella xiaoxiensis TaxID=766895 RepID=A0ABS2SXZ1_9BACI|nr:B12-binding domain-containing protein [Shouchella xiaoxiensis]MBM7840398.1 methanogenic corrinoid protein MtbC1 [Shouchella xiaoxiensis]